MKTLHRFHTPLTLAALLCGSLTAATARAQSADTIPPSPSAYEPAADADTVCVRFRQSRHEVLPTLGSNAEQLRRLGTIFGKDGKVYSGVNGVKVLGAASPEGTVEFNRRLSRRRADAIYGYLNTLGEFPDSLFTFEYAGRDWEGLRRLVEDDREVPDREGVLELLGDVADGALSAHDDDALLARLKKLDGGRSYRYMYDHLFPRLRSTRVIVDYPLAARRRDSEPKQRLRLTEGLPLSMHGLRATPSASLGKLTAPRMQIPFYMSIGTNLLYDAAALPTAKVEFYLGRNWSVAGNWTYGWWDSNHLHRYWRAYGGDISIRKWFGSKAQEKPLTGHHAGVYAGVVTYDFEWGGTGYMGGLPEKSLWDRCNYMAGIEYGYSLPVARRINIDFTIGLGYLWGKYIKYDPVDGYYQYRSTHHLRWFGPTKAEISLIWLIGRGNYNKGKERGR